MGVLVFSSCEGRAPLPDPDREDFGISGDGDGDDDDTLGDEDGMPESGDADTLDEPEECFSVVDTIVIDDDTHPESVGCIEHVLGDLQIGVSTKLLDLSMLSKLRQVDGRLIILGNDALQDLAGLDSLEQVGSLELSRNKTLSNLVGADALTELGQLIVSYNKNMTNLVGLPDGLSPTRVIIEKNPLLQTLDGLPSFVAAPDGDSLRAIIHENPILNSLDGLSDCCADLPLSLLVDNNAKLEHLKGLESFTALTTLELYDNFALIDLEGIEQLSEVGTLRVDYDHCVPNAQPSMLDFSGAESLTQVDVLHLEWIASLTSLGGLHNLTQLSKLSLLNSPALTQSEVDDFIAQTQVMPHEVCGVLDGSACASEPCPMF